MQAAIVEPVEQVELVPGLFSPFAPGHTCTAQLPSPAAETVVFVISQYSRDLKTLLGTGMN